MCDSCEWQDAVQEIAKSISEDDSQFGVETLQKIQEWVLANQHVTPKQLEAIENITTQRLRRMPRQAPKRPEPAPEPEATTAFEPLETPAEEWYLNDRKFHRLVDVFEDAIRRNQYDAKSLTMAAQLAANRWEKRVKRPAELQARPKPPAPKGRSFHNPDSSGLIVEHRKRRAV
jgi:hypothetical protein